MGTTSTMSRITEADSVQACVNKLSCNNPGALYVLRYIAETYPNYKALFLFLKLDENDMVGDKIWELFLENNQEILQTIEKLEAIGYNHKNDQA